MAGSPSDYYHTVLFGVKELELCGYPKVKKFEDMYNRFDTIPATDAQTDGQKSCDLCTLNALNSSLPNRPLHLLVAYVQ